jgi:hypothetical protein
LTGILFLGEGPRDVGTPGYQRVDDDYEGDLPRLVRRISDLLGGPKRFGYDAETLRKVVAPRWGAPTRLGRKSKELRDAVVASVDTFDFVVAVIDVRLEELDDMLADVREVLIQSEARRSSAHVVIGLAVQEIEIWMLADPDSRKAALGAAMSDEEMPANPESHSDPKTLWESMAGRCAPAAGYTPKAFADLQRRKAWEALRPEVVAKACPRGFGPFLRDVGPLLRAWRGGGA